MIDEKTIETLWNWVKRDGVKLLDLFCCGGGASMGYHTAGFPNILGIDIIRVRNYPFDLVKADVMELIKVMPVEWFQHFDLIHASPPCKPHSRGAILAEHQGNKKSTLDLIDPIRQFLIKLDVPYVIENVVGAPMDGIMLCGSSFDLKVRRHRLFECNFLVEPLECRHKEQGKPIGVYGGMGDTVKGTCSKTGKLVIGGSTAKTIKEAQEAMGIDWLGWSKLKEAIPPAYTEYIALWYWRSKGCWT